MFLLEARDTSGQCEPLDRLGDAAILMEAKQGDETAYEELYRRHCQRISRVIFRITQNVEDAEDATQDTFCRAFRNLESFHGRSQFSTWLTRIAINSALMVLRKRARRLELSIDSSYEDEELLPIQLEDPYPNPEIAFLRREGLIRFRSAVQRLPPVLREVAELRCSDDLTLRKIAEIKGISLAAAKSRLLRAGTKLHSRLGPGRERHARDARTAS